jgi:hypothetical protein
MKTFYFALENLALVYVLWFFFLAVMSLSRAKKAGILAPQVKAFGMPFLLVGYVLDFLTNLLPMTILFEQFPEETTVTARLKRYIREGTGWHYRVAEWFIPFLDPFDPSGHHITESPKV